MKELMFGRRRQESRPLAASSISVGPPVGQDRLLHAPPIRWQHIHNLTNGPACFMRHAAVLFRTVKENSERRQMSARTASAPSTTQDSSLEQVTMASAAAPVKK
ncbi:hypothetical protein Bbelb_444790, partial [Branchiostoma belcheri]